VTPVLAELGAWDLDPRRDPAELEAAAALCRSAGYWALPYPVAERLSRPADLDADGLAVVADTVPAAAVAGLDLRWAAVTLDGRMLDRAMELTQAHVLTRKQFGQRLAAFQGVQFQLTEAEVERAGVEILATYALWSLAASPGDAIDDALALRLAAVEAAEVVFRVSHQLHGAIGFCDETPLSWLSRYSQPSRRLPFGLSGTRTALTGRIGRYGLKGLFSPEVTL
jgi:alkylation response protein AidB-like acyl-CoA dehydrogenase